MGGIAKSEMESIAPALMREMDGARSAAACGSSRDDILLDIAEIPEREKLLKSCLLYH